MPRQEEPNLTVRETFSWLAVDELKALLALVRGPVQARKADCASALERRRGACPLDGLLRKVVQEATHDPQGVWPGRGSRRGPPSPLPVFLDDLQTSGAARRPGAARLIGCKDAFVARTLASDRRLRNICQLAGERHLVFRASDEAAVRRALKELGHVLPPPR